MGVRNLPWIGVADMPNITLSVDVETLKKVRKIAVDRSTTLTAMVRDFLRSVSDIDRLDRERAVAELDHGFDELARPMGPRRWTREQLHER